MTVETLATSDIDLFADEVLADPYPYFAQLREQASVVRLEKNGVWALTRYDVIRDALANWEVFSSNAVAFNEDMNQALQGTSLTTDPPEHTALRAALTENLTPRALRGMKADIDAKADAMVARLVEQGSFDAIDDLARALPLQVVSDLIGVSDEVRAKILQVGRGRVQRARPHEPAHHRQLPGRGRAVPVVAAGQGLGPRRGQHGPCDLRRR